MDLGLAWPRSWLELVDSGVFARAAERMHLGQEVAHQVRDNPLAELGLESRPGPHRSGLEAMVVWDITSGDEAALESAAVLIDRDGNRFPIYGVNLVKVRDGKFTHVRAYFDPTQFPQPGSR